MITAGCASSKSPATAIQTPAPAFSDAASATAAPVSGTTSCPDTLVWNGSWDSRELGMAGNHDMTTAFTKNPDQPFGSVTPVNMTQTCRDVEGTLFIQGERCSATFKGTVDKNVLSGTWSSAPGTCTKSQEGRKFSLIMAADNKTWLGDLYDSLNDPAKMPPNWAGRRPVK